MARPHKKGLDYFNVDCNQADNLNLIEVKHGLVGYGVVLKLWKKIYQISGYYCDWNQKNLLLFAREVNVAAELVSEVVESCFEEEIFSREMFEAYKILTSHGIQKRWKKIVTEAKRKDVEIEPNFNLIEETPEETSFTPEETPKIPEETPKILEETTQRKEKENKEKENKKNKRILAAEPQGVFFKKNEEEPPWGMLVKVWFDFVTEKFGKPPLFAGEDPRFFKSIVKKLQTRACQEGIPWSNTTGPGSVRKFLTSAYGDPWIAKHFLLRMIDAKFEKIERVAVGNDSVKSPRKIADEINYLYGRFLEGEARWESYDPSYFLWLQNQNVVQLSREQQYRLRMECIKIRISQLSGSNQAKDLVVLPQYQKFPYRMVEADKMVLERLINKRGLFSFFTELRKSKNEKIYLSNKEAVTSELSVSQA